MALSWTTQSLVVAWQRPLIYFELDFVKHLPYFYHLICRSIFFPSPGTKHERGLLDWNKVEQLDGSEESMPSEELFDLPFGITTFLSSRSWVRFIPFCPWNSDENLGMPAEALQTGNQSQKRMEPSGRAGALGSASLKITKK